VTFTIDWFVPDHPRWGQIVRLRDETRYVEDIVTQEQLENMPQLSSYEKRQLMHAMLKVLCRKWYETFGEYLEPVAPDAPGVAWTVRRVEGPKEVTDAERPSIEGGGHER